LGGAIVLFKVVVPVHVALGLELAVAAMLVALGLANLAAPRLPQVTAAGTTPSAAAWSPLARTGSVANIRPLFVGVVHGLAGSAAIALLVLSTIGDSRWALGYLAIFGAGTITGMALLTTAMALPMAYASSAFTRLNRSLARATGLASIALGVVIAWQLLFQHGLLSSTPRWVPD
jgi:high-affinity nickel-transport protein